MLNNKKMFQIIKLLCWCKFELKELRDVDEDGDENDDPEVERRTRFILEGVADCVKTLGSDGNDHVNAT